MNPARFVRAFFMAKLTSRQRAAMPQSEYALPGKRFPIENGNHARAALSMAPRAYKAGHITLAQLNRIRSKAKAKLSKP
jgi:hypothetical protein